jgi:hypothetical protein
MTDSWHHSDTLLRQLDEQGPSALAFQKSGITDPDVSAHTGFLGSLARPRFEATHGMGFIDP